MLRTSLLLSGFALALSACIPDKLNTEPEVRGVSLRGSMMEVHQPQDGDRLSVTSGRDVRIFLQSNVTTGYLWYFTQDIDGAVFEFRGGDYMSDPNPRGMAGVGGMQTFDFSAISPGKVVLAFRLSRGMDGPPAETRRITVLVTP